MNKNKQITCESFNSEVFLYIDQDLSGERKNFVENHLSECAVCKSLLKEVKSLTVDYDALPLENIDNSLFNNMINKATKVTPIGEIKQETYFQKRKSLVEMFGFYRLAIGGATIAAAIILIIIFFVVESDIKKGVPTDILDWHGEKITNQIERIEDRILSLKSDDWDIYIIRKNKRARKFYM